MGAQTAPMFCTRQKVREISHNWLLSWVPHAFDTSLSLLVLMTASTNVSIGLIRENFPMSLGAWHAFLRCELPCCVPRFCAPTETSWYCSVGLLVFCFAGHSVFPEIMSSMKTPRHGPRVMNQTFLVVTPLYVFLAVVGYLWLGIDAPALVRMRREL